MNTLLKDYFSKYLSASDQILNFQFSFQVKLIISVGVVLVMCILYFLSKKVTSERSTINGYVQCYLEMAELISTKDCHPILLRLAWSDAATYDQSVRDWPRCGGVTGSIRFDKEITHPSNAGLSKALQYLRPFRKKYRFISWSDLIQMAGSLAVELSGGPSLQSFMVYGRMDAPVPARNPALINSSDMKRNSRGRLSIGQNTSNDMLPDQRNKLGVSPTRLSIEHSGIRISGKFYSSSSPSSTPSDYLASRLPVAEPPYPDGIPTAEAHIRNTFYRMGFKNREIVALCGAHTIGRAFKDRSGVCAYASGDLSATKYTKQNSIAKAGGRPGIGMAGGCSWTRNWLQFDNSYYKRIEELLASNNPSSPAPATTLSSLSSDSTEGVDGSDELLWLSTDWALYQSSEFRPHFLRYARDQNAFFEDYSSAHKKMSELGARWSTSEGVKLPHIDIDKYINK